MSSAILKWTTLLAIVSAVVMALLGIVSIFYPPIQTRVEWYLSILLLVLAAMLSYLYGRIELMEKQTSLIVRKLGLHIETFRNRDDLFRRMRYITVGSQMVSTQMFSDPPTEISTEMEKYFKEVGSYTKKNPEMIFRRIATLGDSRKVRWLLKLISEMVGIENFSLAYIAIDHTTTPLLCLHIAERDGELFTFIFHTVPASGDICAFLIQSAEVGQVALDYYNGLWAKAPKLIEGRRININSIEELVKRYNLEDSEEYKNLKKKL